MATDYTSWGQIINRGNGLCIVGTDFKSWTRIKKSWSGLEIVETDFLSWPRIVSRGHGHVTCVSLGAP